MLPVPLIGLVTAGNPTCVIALWISPSALTWAQLGTPMPAARRAAA
ncbi:hypothetical protein ACVWW5_007000 [Bradyrhizobium sp. LM3.4]